MTLSDEMKTLNQSKLNNFALTHNPSSASLISRSLSSCSTEDFLPTFESEDDDWRKFGWLLELNNIKLPCLDEDRKLLKVDNVDRQIQSSNDENSRPTKQVSDEITALRNEAATKDEECVDPSEFCWHKCETTSQRTNLTHHRGGHDHSEIDRSITPRSADLPTPCSYSNDGIISALSVDGDTVEYRDDEQSNHSIVEMKTNTDEENGKRNEEEPVARRTRFSSIKSDYSSLPSPSNLVSNRKIMFTIGDFNDKSTDDLDSSSLKSCRSDSDGRSCEHVAEIEQPQSTVSSRTVSVQCDLDEEMESECGTDSESEPIAKRTRHSLPSISLSDHQITIDNWLSLVDEPLDIDDTPPTRSKSKSATKSKKRKYNKRLYCVCQKPYDRRQFYVGCDGCNDWFHPACIGITEMDAIRADEYFCPKCKRLKESDEKI
ncbi:unnamed protein product [Anisakis simplex]|uniref:PHD-type domain-containing protein n=1 Tax=Anisakis simplex TaxID=6269 RepID=A0A0M3K3U8_ANISI|nr:unnamed protein product [Anisakis simplex]